jgi:hypothetical protein
MPKRFRQESQVAAGCQRHLLLAVAQQFRNVRSKQLSDRLQPLRFRPIAQVCQSNVAEFDTNPADRWT